MTAATTRIGRVDLGSGIRGRRDGALHVEAEELLPHEQDVARRERMLGSQPDERAVRATHVREVHVAVRFAGKAAVQAGDVAVFREEYVAALAAEVNAGFRDRERIARRVAPDDE